MKIFNILNRSINTGILDLADFKFLETNEKVFVDFLIIFKFLTKMVCINTVKLLAFS